MEFYSILGSILGLLIFVVLPVVMFCWLIVAIIRYLNRH